MIMLWTHFVNRIGESWQRGHHSLENVGMHRRIPLMLTAWLLAFPLFASEPIFTPDEEADFYGTGDVLCQQALGLSFVLPPPGFKIDRDAQDNLVKTLRKPGPSAWGWAWLNNARSQMILVQVVKGPRTAEDFLFFAKKVEDGLFAAGSLQGVEKQEEIAERPYRFRLKATLAENAFDIACVSTPARHTDPAVACMVTLAADHDLLAKNRNSLAFGACGQGG